MLRGENRRAALTNCRLPLLLPPLLLLPPPLLLLPPLAQSPYRAVKACPPPWQIPSNIA